MTKLRLAQRHGDDDVADLVQPAMTVAAKRNVEIVAQPK
jgi:hypothetical protein